MTAHELLKRAEIAASGLSHPTDRLSFHIGVLSGMVKDLCDEIETLKEKIHDLESR